MRIYGELDSASVALQRVALVLGDEWQGATARMRKEDIVRATDYVVQILKSCKEIKMHLASFSTIVLPETSGTINTIKITSSANHERG